MGAIMRRLLVDAAVRNQINFFSETSVHWTNSEKSELERLRIAYPSPQFEIECDLAENGDPWCVVTDPSFDRVIVHIARIGQNYIVIHPERSVSTKVSQIKTAVDLVVR